MKRHMRVAAEMANLPSLAVYYASSILVRQDEASMDFLQAAVLGPADTPYMNGVFLFDIFLPPVRVCVPPVLPLSVSLLLFLGSHGSVDAQPRSFPSPTQTYPSVCPNVILLTTGGGAARFNPNL